MIINYLIIHMLVPANRYLISLEYLFILSYFTVNCLFYFIDK